MTQRVTKEKGPCKIGSSQFDKVSLTNVLRDLQTSIYSWDYLGKPNVGTILIILNLVGEKDLYFCYPNYVDRRVCVVST
jgi:hypothetical protein